MTKKHTFEGEIIGQSTKAVLFQSVYWHAPLWLPKSQAEIEVDEDGVVLTISNWLAGKNNLMEFTEYTEEAIEERTYKE